MPTTAPPRAGRFLALLLLILAVLFWGFSFISTKVILESSALPPASIAFFRQIITVIVLLPWVARALIRERFAQLSGISWWDGGLVAASGMCGIVLYFVFENNGIRLSTASNASLIVAAVPIFTLFTEALFFKLTITKRLIVCLALSVLGVFLVVSGGGRLDFSSARFAGNMLVVAAMVSWVCYTILNKRLTNRFPTLLLTFFQSFFSIFLFVPFLLPEIKSWRVPPVVPFLHLLYLGVCCSALGYIFYIFAVKRLGATISSAFLNLVPVVTVVCGYFVLGERIEASQIMGMVLIVISLYAVSARPWIDKRREATGKREKYSAIG